MTWMPKKRNITYQEKPVGIPDKVYTMALAAKRSYNEDWEFWVHAVAVQHNVSVPMAEDACIRGLKKEILRHKFVYGDAVGEWLERFLDMGDIFSKVKHPDYIKQLG